MIESPLIQEIMQEFKWSGQVKTICRVLEVRFGEVSPTVTGGLEEVKDEGRLNRLAGLAALSASLQAFEQRLHGELLRPAAVSKRERRRLQRASE
jgi:hypothetical protein